VRTCSSVLRSYEVYGPSVSLLGRRMVYGRPEPSSAISLSCLNFNTPAQHSVQSWQV
jgi:hypothetical protein